MSKFHNPLFYVAAISLAALAHQPGNAIAKGGLAPIAPEYAKDFNPDPNIVEVVIVASVDSIQLAGPSGPMTDVYAYNGLVPGPTIEGNVGNTLIVHFINLLPEDTTIHWHGMDVPANMDGSNIAQGAIPPGGYFRYEFTLLQASLFWYHPHIRTNVQVERSLHGALIVHDPAQDVALGIPPEREHILVLDDVLLDGGGQIVDPFPTDPLENAITQINGREGNYLLANGTSGARARIRREAPHRLRVVNVSNSRFMRLSIPNHTMLRVGGDGGLLEEAIPVPPIGLIPDPDNPGSTISDPDPTKGIILTPGERADIVFRPRPRGRVSLQWHDYPRGRHSAFYMGSGAIGLGDDENDGKLPPQELFAFESVNSGGRAPAWSPPSPLTSITPINVVGAGVIPWMLGHTPPAANGDVTFFMQMKAGAPLPFDLVTPADAPDVIAGETKIWQVMNMTGGDHNFHTHGFSFQLIETQFVDMDNPGNNYTIPAPYLETKDTIILPKRPGMMMRSSSITRLAVTFDDTGREGQIAASGKVPGEGTSGGWLAHCHILEHSARGMMSFFEVFNP